MLEKTIHFSLNAKNICIKNNNLNAKNIKFCIFFKLVIFDRENVTLANMVLNI